MASSPLNPPPPPLPYASGARRTARFSFSWGIFAWSGAVVFAWLAITLLVVPRFESAFRDFKMELPATTKALLTLMRIASGPVWLVLLLSIPFALGFAAGPLSPPGRRAFRIIATLVMGALVVFTVLAIVQPLMMLVEGISQAK
jgi:hypothetical protein